MRSLATILILAGLLFAAAGCEDDNGVLLERDDPPATPQGVFSVTGDGVVWVIFNGIYEHDVAEYIIWRSLDSVQGFTEVGRVQAVDNPNLDLIIYEFPDNTVVNGVTYYYAVSAVDFAGQMSELSAERVFDTPRPDGSIVLVTNDMNNGALAGFNLATATVVPDTSVLADFYIDRVIGGSGDTTLYINIGNLDFIYGDIQDMGFTEDFDEIGWAPTQGWSELGYSELLLGHTYVIRTQTGNYAKVRSAIINKASGVVQFEWAYQTVVDNPELAPPAPLNDRRPRPDKRAAMTDAVSVR